MNNNLNITKNDLLKIEEKIKNLIKKIYPFQKFVTNKKICIKNLQQN